jgi:uncharacterized Zn finger protein (UPF0148 family)
VTVYRASACRVCGEVFDLGGETICAACTAAAARQRAEAQRLQREERRHETKHAIAGVLGSGAVALAMATLIAVLLFFIGYVYMQAEW